MGPSDDVGLAKKWRGCWHGLPGICKGHRQAPRSGLRACGDDWLTSDNGRQESVPDPDQRETICGAFP
jgi:hypothetical protein